MKAVPENSSVKFQTRIGRPEDKKLITVNLKLTTMLD